MKTTSRLALAAATLAAASLVLTGCFGQLVPVNGATSGPQPTKTASVEGIATELLPYYEQPVDWEECGIGFFCSTVTAPLDWADPTVGDLELAVVRHPATGGEAVGSLLTNPGGPGGSGIALVQDSLDYAFGEGLIESFDIIGWDPRGVGESTPVTCLDDGAMDSYLYDIPVAPRGSEEWEAELLERSRVFADACEANSGGILPYITTQNSARDMDLLRSLLGDEKLNYLGYSYGTFLGATYAELFPDRVGRLVLDGAIDPAVPGIEVGTIQAVGFESALRAYMADCITTSECAFRGTVDQAMADLSTMLASVESVPLEAKDGRQLGADSLMLAIIAALYNVENWPYLTQAIADVAKGDPEFAFVLADFYNGREGGVYLDNSTEAFRAYNCVDYPDDATPEQEAAADALLQEKAPTVAPYWNGPDACSVWPHPPTGQRVALTAEGAPPILVVGTTNDPATPYEWSVSLAEQLASGVLITRVGEGHTGYNQGNVCVDAAVEDYLINGTVPEDGLTCE